MEIPIYDDLPMLGNSAPDGPRLILCVAIPNPGTEETSGVDSQSVMDCEYLDLLNPPSFSSYEVAEEQVAREMAHKMTRRFLAPGTSSDLRDVIGISTVMLNVKREAERLASKNSPLLLLGDSGTGKTKLAKAIHLASKRSQKRFEPVEGSPDDLFYGYLFGWEKGSHSTAYEKKNGIAFVANGGTLFIDDVDKLSPRVQGELLRFLDEKKFKPLGATADVDVDVRIIVATNKPLKQLAESGQFRLDLYYRIAANVIKLPPLCDRKEDIPIWAEKFLEEISMETGRRASLTPAAIEILLQFDWPGNLRTLKNALDKASDLAVGGDIRPEHLSLGLDDEWHQVDGNIRRPQQNVTEVLLGLPGNTIDEKLQVARGILIANEYGRSIS